MCYPIINLSIIDRKHSRDSRITFIILNLTNTYFHYFLDIFENSKLMIYFSGRYIFFYFGHFYYFQPNKYLPPKIFSKIDDLFLRNQVEFVFLLLAIFSCRTDVNPRHFLQPNFRRGAALFV